MSSSDTGLKEDRPQLLLLGLVTQTDTDDQGVYCVVDVFDKTKDELTHLLAQRL